MTPNTPALDEHARLAAEVAMRLRRPQEIAEERRQRQADFERAKQDHSRYLADVEMGAKRDTARERRLIEAVATAERALNSEQWQQRISAAQLVVHDAKRELEEFRAKRVDDLIVERVQLAKAARDRFVEDMQRVQESLRALERQGADWGLLLNHVPGASMTRRDHGPPMQHRLQQAMLELERVLESPGVQLPVPRVLAAGEELVAA